MPEFNEYQIIHGVMPEVNDIMKEILLLMKTTDTALNYKKMMTPPTVLTYQIIVDYLAMITPPTVLVYPIIVGNIVKKLNE